MPVSIGGFVMNTGDFSSLSRQDSRPSILFIGDTTSFSDMYIRLIKSEFPDVNVQRAVNTSEANPGNHNSLRAVVMACREGVDALGRLQSWIQMDPSLRPVLAYQTMSEARTVLEAINDRSLVERLSFLPLRARMDCTVTILRLVMSGERHVSGEVLDTLMAWKAEDASDADEGWTLTAREKEVLEHLSKGASNKLIARELELAESTVKLHIHHIIRKLGVRNRTEAAVAYVAGLAKMQVAS